MKQFIRNFKKQQTIGVLNICSLSLGIMVAIIVGLWAINELSFDRFHKNKDRIYRTVEHISQNGIERTIGSTYRPFGEQVKDELPVMEDMCRVVTNNQNIVINDILYPATNALMADPNFFTFFTFPLKDGNVQHLLSSPDKVVISESAAKKYFSGQNPVGQIIKCEGNDFAISGVMKDMPKNSSLQADFIFPFFGWWATAEWGNADSWITFFLLQKGISAETTAESIKQIAYQSFEPFKRMEMSFSLQPLVDMHFSSLTFDRIPVKGNKSFVMVFVLTALVILIISCINFANLFVSTSFIRAKTIGIKKTVGAKKRLLIREFFLETACYVFVSIAAGLALAEVIMPVFNNFTQSGLTLDFTAPQIYLFLSVLFVCVVLLAGSFPALYMTRFNPLETIKGKFRGKKISFFQKSLAITQFAASIILLIVVMFMQKQVNYIVSYDLGFNKEHVLYVQGRDNFEQNFTMLEGEFLTEPTITAVTRRNALPSKWSNGWIINKLPLDNSQGIAMDICWVSPNHFDFFDMKIIDGENPFFYESSTAYDVVINESAARLLGLEQPVGEMITNGYEDSRYTIRGVTRNAYTRSLHQEVDPQVFIKMDREKWNSVFFKINGDPQRAIRFIEQKWKAREADFPFEYHFLDDTYKQLYTSEMNAGKVLSFAMLITLMITVADLFAMAYYATRRRVREIAIRKVYGASIRHIFVLLNKGFILWVGIAFLIACPVAFYGLNKWLDGFVVKTDLSIWVFILVGAIALLVTLLTNGYQTWKAATGNPVKAIKTE